ncbi:MAG: homoserine dehydrogenase [Actinomycetota bacterium]
MSEAERGPGPPDGAAKQPIRIGLLGCGTVGSALVSIVGAERDAIRARTGLDLSVERVAVRNLTAHRDVDLAEGVLTRDAHSVVTDPDVDLVVELIGGIEPARTLIADALRNGKPVVTGNKDLIANVGPELAEIAGDAGVDLLYEAAVAGGIPLLRALRESLAGERIRRMLGIVNGTTNFILTKMTEEGADYGATLSEAQQLGYAEADPTADVEGHDAGAKAAILAMIAFGAHVVQGDVHTEGISQLGVADIEAADRMQHVIKLLAIVEEVDGEVAARVHPTMVPTTHPLASVRDSFNAVFVEGDAVGELMLYGRGAGGHPTASAVLGDVLAAATNLRQGTSSATGPLRAVTVRPIDETESAFYVPLDVHDRPGVLAEVAGVFGRHGVSIRSMEQAGRHGEAHLVFITHLAREADLQSTLDEVGRLDAVIGIGAPIRVIGADE